MDNRFERRPFRTLVGLGVVGALAVGMAFEAAYRSQVVDFYRPELTTANRARDLEPGWGPGKTILVMGDSFTAWPSGYPSVLTERLGSEFRVINSGVSGFTLRQMVRLLPRRLAEFKPDAVIVQLFAGNDLLEMNHPRSWSRLSPARNLFWLVSDTGFESVAFLNYRLGSTLGAFWRGVRGDPPFRFDEGGEPFSVARYSRHEQTLISAEPDHVDQQLRVSKRYTSVYAEYLALLETTLALIEPGRRKTTILVVPHPTEIHGRYIERHRALGGVVLSLLEPDRPSPFLQGVAAVVSSHPEVRLIDPRPVFREREDQGTILFRATDLHLNRRGQDVLADLLMARIVDPPDHD